MLFQDLLFSTKPKQILKQPLCWPRSGITRTHGEGDSTGLAQKMQEVYR
jgi:hypothetical protein